MKKIRLLIGLILLAFLIVGILLDSQVIVPSTLVFILLYVISILGGFKKEFNNIDRCAQLAIKIYSWTIAVLNILISLLFPLIANYYNLTSLFDGDFVRVTINDINEFSYGACFLLLINIVLLVVHRKKSFNACVN